MEKVDALKLVQYISEYYIYVLRKKFMPVSCITGAFCIQLRGLWGCFFLYDLENIVFMSIPSTAGLFIGYKEPS